MPLSSALIADFVKSTVEKPIKHDETTAYGTVKIVENVEYVMLDGSELMTPVSTTVSINDGDRVKVSIKNHSAIIVGNLEDRSASSKDVSIINSILKQEDGEFIQVRSKFDQYDSILTQEDGTLIQVNSKFEEVDSDISAINSTVTIHDSAFTIDDGVVTGLSTIILNTLDAKYADIEFANIGEAAIGKLYSDSGLIKNLAFEDGHVTGELSAVTVHGDLIEANSIKADKLLVRGEDGLYYSLNIDGMNNISTEKAGVFDLLTDKPEDWETSYTKYYEIVNDEYVRVTSDEAPSWTSSTYYKLSSAYQGALDGSVLVAKSVTADQIYCSDLYTFAAKIGNINIKEHGLYSGSKGAVDSTNPGFYLDDAGQFILGDTTNYLKYHKDSNGQWKLDISDVMNVSSYCTPGTTTIDGGHITTGTINADQIAAGAITSDKLDVNGVATFFNGGGRNFLRNTGHVQTWRQLQESTSSFIDDRTVRINKMETADDWNSGVQTWPRVDTLELIGKTVTLSFWAKIVARPQTIDSPFTIAFNTSASSNKTGTRANYKTISFVFPLSDEETGEFIPLDTWKKFTYTIENLSEDFFSSGSGGVGAFFYLAIYNRSPNRFYFKDFKIEEGHVATTWSPSPLDDNYSVVENGVTVIDGGKIMTGSITANQIKAGSITATELDVESIFARDIIASGYIGFINSKYNFIANDETGDITIAGKTNGSDITIRAKHNLVMTNEGGDISLSAANAITFNTASLGHVYIETASTRYPVGAYSYHAGTSSGKWSYKKWIDGTVDLWCYINIDTTSGVPCPNDFGGIMKMTDPISIPDYPFALSSVRDIQLHFETILEGRGAFVWSGGKKPSTSPGAFRLVRPTNDKLYGYVYVSVKGVI